MPAELLAVDEELKNLRHAERGPDAEAGADRRQIEHCAGQLLAGGAELDGAPLVGRRTDFASALQHRRTRACPSRLSRSSSQIRLAALITGQNRGSNRPAQIQRALMTLPSLPAGQPALIRRSCATRPVSSETMIKYLIVIL